MNTQFKHAYEYLRSMGVPVYEHADDDGNFSIQAPSEWANYYGPTPEWVFGVHPKVDATLSALGLYAEWVNPERLSVYPN